MKKDIDMYKARIAELALLSAYNPSVKRGFENSSYLTFNSAANGVTSQISMKALKEENTTTMFINLLNICKANGLPVESLTYFNVEDPTVEGVNEVIDEIKENLIQKIYDMPYASYDDAVKVGEYGDLTYKAEYSEDQLATGEGYLSFVNTKIVKVFRANAKDAGFSDEFIDLVEKDVISEIQEIAGERIKKKSRALLKEAMETSAPADEEKTEE